MTLGGRLTSAITAIGRMLALQLIVLLGFTALGTILLRCQRAMKIVERMLCVELVHRVAFRLLPAASWELVLVSNENNDDFKYFSERWTTGTPFNTGDTTDTKNALFPAYTSIFVEKVRIEMDGTASGTCGSACSHVFALPDAYKGKYTLQELVTMGGGVRGALYVCERLCVECQ